MYYYCAGYPFLLNGRYELQFVKECQNRTFKVDFACQKFRKKRLYINLEWCPLSMLIFGLAFQEPPSLKFHNRTDIKSYTLSFMPRTQVFFKWHFS